jgi:thiazole/oxazole-forming peptide maturase SagC family component
MKTNDFKVILFDAGIIGTTLLEQLANNKRFSITVIDSGKVNYQNVSSGVYPKKYFGRLRSDALKEKFDNLKFLNKKISDLVEKDLGADILVCASDEFNLEENNQINKLVFNKNLRLLTARLIENHLGEVGPFIAPNQTSCFKCYETRIRANLEDADNYFKKKISFGDSEKLRQLNALRKSMASLMELEISRLSSGENPKLVDKVISIDLNENTMSEEKLFRIPFCEVCDSK